MTLHKTIYLRATKADIWPYLTEPDKLAIWFHAPKMPLTENTSYEMFGTSSGNKLMWGDVIKATPHDYLEYTFTIAPMDGAVSTVKISLDDVPGGTRLSLTHEGLPEGKDAFNLTLALDAGWDDHLNRMRADIHA